MTLAIMTHYCGADLNSAADRVCGAPTTNYSCLSISLVTIVYITHYCGADLNGAAVRVGTDEGPCSTVGERDIRAVDHNLIRNHVEHIGHADVVLACKGRWWCVRVEGEGVARTRKVS